MESKIMNFVLQETMWLTYILQQVPNDQFAVVGLRGASKKHGAYDAIINRNLQTTSSVDSGDESSSDDRKLKVSKNIRNLQTASATSSVDSGDESSEDDRKLKASNIRNLQAASPTSSVDSDDESSEDDRKLMA
jgi:hypothetical protein